MRQNYPIPNLIFREDFVSEDRVLENGIEIIGSPTINNGISGFSSSDYATITLNKYLPELSIFIRCKINSDTDSGRVISSPSNWDIRTSLSGTTLTWSYSVSGTTETSNGVSILTGADISIGLVFEKSGANTLQTPVYNGVFGSQSSDAGDLDFIDYFDIGFLSGVNEVLDGEVYDILLFDTVLTELDFAKLHAGEWS